MILRSNSRRAQPSSKPHRREYEGARQKRSELRAISHDAAARIGLPLADDGVRGGVRRDASRTDRRMRCRHAAGDVAEAPPGGDAGPDATEGLPRVGGNGKGWLWINWVQDGYEALPASDSATAQTDLLRARCLVVRPTGPFACGFGQSAGSAPTRLSQGVKARLGKWRGMLAGGAAVDLHGRRA